MFSYSYQYSWLNILNTCAITAITISYSEFLHLYGRTDYILSLTIIHENYCQRNYSAKVKT